MAYQKITLLFFCSVLFKNISFSAHHPSVLDHEFLAHYRFASAHKFSAHHQEKKEYDAT